MRTIVYSTQYKKDRKKAAQRNLPIDKLESVIQKMQNDIPLGIENRDHALTGNFSTCRECHILPDWLLIYRKIGKDNDTIQLLNLVRLGSHSDLFK